MYAFIAIVLRTFGQLIDLASNDDIPEHSIQWVAHEAGFGMHWTEMEPAGFLPLGLGILHQLVLQTAYSERSRLLSNQSLSSDSFWHVFLSRQNSAHYLPSRFLEEKPRGLIPQQVAHDDDTGPRDAWRWAHAYYPPSSWHDTKIRNKLRKNGYVFWDSARLVEWRIYQ